MRAALIQWVSLYGASKSTACELEECLRDTRDEAPVNVVVVLIEIGLDCFRSMLKTSRKSQQRD